MSKNALIHSQLKTQNSKLRSMGHKRPRVLSSRMIWPKVENLYVCPRIRMPPKGENAHNYPEQIEVLAMGLFGDCCFRWDFRLGGRASGGLSIGPVHTV